VVQEVVLLVEQVERQVAPVNLTQPAQLVMVGRLVGSSSQLRQAEPFPVLAGVTVEPVETILTFREWVHMQRPVLVAAAREVILATAVLAFKVPT
jgi:hypothetical protein